MNQLDKAVQFGMCCSRRALSWVSLCSAPKVVVRPCKAACMCWQASWVWPKPDKVTARLCCDNKAGAAVGLKWCARKVYASLKACAAAFNCCWWLKATPKLFKVAARLSWVRWSLACSSGKAR